MIEKKQDNLKDLWVKYKLKGNMEYRNELIIHYSPIVNKIVNRMAFKYLDYVEFDDMVGYGIFGLIDAIDKFDIDKGIKFETYASIRIRGAIIDQIRKLDWVPRNLREKAKKVNKAIEELEKKLGREPNSTEIANHLDITQPEFDKLMGNIHTFLVVSLDDDLKGVLYEMDPNQTNITPTPEGYVLEEETRKRLAVAVNSLSENEQKIVSLYYFEELTLREIGMIIGVSESRVSQLHSRVLLKLKKHLGSEFNEN